ncbi:MAG: class II aldolase/adducin family protein [Gammaproteobacteria bacterium]
MTSKELREDIIDHARDFEASGLSVGKSGNISARYEQGFVITPTGFAYADLQPDNLAFCNMDGSLIDGDWAPSSEWPFHAAIYQAREDINAIVHCHSTYATAIACNRKPIPAFHYMVATVGGNSIECADYATFGSVELSRNAVQALGNRKACLLANHGQVATGNTVAGAYQLAREVEALARQYCISLQFGEPVLLDDEEMARNVEKFKRYGRQQEAE